MLECLDSVAVVLFVDVDKAQHIVSFNAGGITLEFLLRLTPRLVE